MKIRVREIVKGCKFAFIDKGEWIDLIAAEDMTFKAPQAKSRYSKTVDGVTTYYRDVVSDTALIPLGISMKLPKGYEAMILPRSSTPSRFGIKCTNSEGVIDSSYSGNEDEWKFPVVATRHTTIKKGDRICQFRIQLSQKATSWQKIKWLFDGKPEFIWVDDLGTKKNRGGFGTTGK